MWTTNNLSSAADTGGVMPMTRNTSMGILAIAIREEAVKKNLFAYITAITLIAILALPTRLTAQARYRVVDMGTFGGPQGFLFEQTQVLNNQGVLTGWLDTSTPDPNFPQLSNCFNPGDCFFSHAFQWQAGHLTDLGTLPGGLVSVPVWISDNGLIAGFSENGVTDPLIGLTEDRAVLWKNGTIINLQYSARRKRKPGIGRQQRGSDCGTLFKR
jgi:hypothetical protein